MQERALSDVKVLDLTWYIAGPCCTKLLADYGAEVIKVENPSGGDPARRLSPFFKDDPHTEKSAYFLHLNTNKRGITLNLKSETGRKIFKELLKDVDILVESFSPHVMPSLGLDYETLEKVNPKLVMTSISSFGQTGPYRDFKMSELILNGVGAQNAHGLSFRYPLKRALASKQYGCGAIAAVVTMVALTAQEASGVGQHIDLSLMEAQMQSSDMRSIDIMGSQHSGKEEVFFRADPRDVTMFPYGVQPCKDGYFEALGSFMFWPRICKMIDRPDLVSDPRGASIQDAQDPQNKEWFMNEIYLPWLLEHTKKECEDASQAAGVLSGPIYTPADVVNDPHWKERGFWVEIEHPATGKVTYPGAPFKMSETPWQVKMPAPLLGQHNQEVYGKLGYSKEDLVKLREGGVI